MTYEQSPLRPGLTAIAAVLALSATPLFAQSADPAPAASGTPVLVAPPPVTPTVSVPVLTVPAAPASATPNIVSSTPQPTATQAVAADEPASTPVPRVKTTKASTAQTTRHIVAETAAPVAKPVAKVAAPVAAVPEPVAVPPSAQPRAIKATQTVTTDETLPIAAGAGLLVLALAGGAFAIGRRKRAEEVDTIAMPETMPETMAVPVAQPAFERAGPATPDPVIDGPRTDIPAGFDMARFGPHMQAAYRGPTADNPSLSLRRRLKRASFFDQRERMAGMPQPAKPETRVAAKPAIAQNRTTDHIVSRVKAPKPTFRPVFQS